MSKGPAYEKARVLIVEDETFTRDIIKRLLLQIGVRSVKEAADGGTGFAALLVARPHLVLCDVHMKPIGGLEFMRMVRQSEIPWVAATKIVMLTADSQVETVMNAKVMGVEGYIVKPVSLNSVKLKLDRALEGVV